MGLSLLRTCRAIGAHSLLSDHGIPNRFDRPLIRIDARPTSTRSCGKLFSSLTGEFGLNSPRSYPPGSFSVDPSKSHMPTAAAASCLASSFSSTPSCNAKFPIRSRSSGRSSPILSSSAIMTFAKVSRFLPEICFTWPKSIKPMSPLSRTKIFPMCGSVESERRKRENISAQNHDNKIPTRDAAFPTDLRGKTRSQECSGRKHTSRL